MNGGSTPDGPSQKVVVVVHGGSWKAGFDRRVMRPVCRDLVRRGWAAWNVEYRRMGGGQEGGWPATFEDVAAAVDALADCGAPVDLDRVVLLGHSAGGTLALHNANPDWFPVVAAITKGTEKAAGSIPGPLGTGGMMSKLAAARKVNSAGVPMVIAKGDKPDILTRLLDGEPHGTYFVPRREKLTRRKCWIAFSLKPKGSLTVDAGAKTALTRRGKSLLASGVVGVQGEFAVGAAVEFRGPEGEPLGVGLVNYSAADIRRVMGLRSQHIRQVLGHKSYDEVIHRDNLVITRNLEEGEVVCL